MTAITVGQPLATVRDRFLPGDLRDRLLARILERESEFTWAATRRGSSPHRRALELATRHLGPLEEELLWSLCKGIDDGAGGLGIDPAQLATLTVTVTASQAGCYYRPHRDRSAIGPESTRVVSAVAFLHDRPARFRGGELWMHGPASPTASGAAERPVTVIPPVDNRLVLFDSRILHEVRPVTTSDDRFSSSRFSIVAWAS